MGETGGKTAIKDWKHELAQRVPRWLFGGAFLVIAFIIFWQFVVRGEPFQVGGEFYGPGNQTAGVHVRSGIPDGAIIGWYLKDAENIPTGSGWNICGTDTSTPDLSDQFLMGANTMGDSGVTGGTANITGAPAHDHGGITAGPSQQAGVRDGNAPLRSHPNHTHAVSSGGQHTHNKGENRPPFFSVIFLCKTSAPS
jgi:hypothetical protein